MPNIESSELHVETRPLSKAQFVWQLIQGIGIALGLGLLSVMEIVRNWYFRLLDRLNVKARRRRASPFPPGNPNAKQHPEPGM